MAERFTPMCVGKSANCAASSRSAAVDPHVCGEIGRSHSFRNRRVRFTPTCVGKSPVAAARPHAPAVHPHVCGEIIASVRSFRLTPGSPPRVWGNLQVVMWHGCGVRFTPTCVGKSGADCRNRTAHSVHPHVCGEIVSITMRPPSTVGSPPRVWGNPERRQGHAGRIRFTPTCVGKSPRSSRPSTSCRFTPTCVGNLRRLARRVHSSRFTPTCVGKSF